MRDRSAITIVELLIAMVIFGVIITLLGRVFVGSTRAYNVNEQVSEERQVVQTVEELLRYEIGIAGYRCTDAGARTRSFAGSPVEILSSGAVRVRYYEDRFTSGACDLTTATFRSDGTDLLRESEGVETTIVRGVTSLEVAYWLNEANSQFVVDAPPPNDVLAGLGLEVVLADGSTHVTTISLRNPQCPVLEDCL